MYPKKRLNPKAEAWEPNCNDGFDSLIWDPDLPSGSGAALDRSPEPVVLEPVQPVAVAYTTVGSLINPNAVREFTAPNRIQREGARRPLMSLLNRSYGMGLSESNHSIHQPFHPRLSQAPLSSQNSMYYAQQLGRGSGPGHFNLAEPLGPEHYYTREDEEAVVSCFMASGEPVPCGSRSETSSIFVSTLASSSMSSPSKVLPTGNGTMQGQAFNGAGFAGETRGRSNDQGPVPQGLEKMQTLQAISKFDNPLQNLARSRLSAFSLANSQSTAKTVTNPNGVSPLEMLLHHHTTAPNQGVHPHVRGSFDQGYQFPRSGTATSHTSQTSQVNPLLGASSFNTPPYSASAPSRPPGYPQPLTAGPPGQRQYGGSSSHTSSGHGGNPWGGNQNASMHGSSNPQSAGPQWANMHSSSSQPSGSNAASTPQPSGSNGASTSQPWGSNGASPWGSNAASTSQPRGSNGASPWGSNAASVFNGFTNTYSSCNSKIVDTLPPETVSQYYPNGQPSDMKTYVPLSLENEIKMKYKFGNTREDQYTIKAIMIVMETNAFFYFGQNEYHKQIMEEAIEEELKRVREAPKNFGPIAPPSKEPYPPGPYVPPKISIEQMNKMSTAEAAKPLINALFITLFRYALRGPNSYRDLSRWVDSPEEHIDSSPEGNQSVFGEDWGAPPKQ